MTSKSRNRMLRHQVRQVRIELLRILDWIESEPDHVQPAGDEHEPPQKSMDSAALPISLEEQEPLTDRHYWILSQLAEGTRLTRKHVMEKFGYSVRPTKRIPGALTSRGLIEFQQDSRPGHYVLCARAGRRSQPASPLSSS